MKVFDSHIHIFTPKVISNVQQKPQMVERLKLQTDGAEKRIDPDILEKEMKAVGVDGALMLPTASVQGVKKTNRGCVELASRYNYLNTAGTLHPDYDGIKEEIAYLQENNIRIVKLCSFSQGFVLNAPATLKMLDVIQDANEGSETPFAVILDTLRTADVHFGTLPKYTTTPQLLGELADRYQGVNFIGAHMGGLDAQIDEIRQYLTPRPNLYLDTSNAGHTLPTDEFLRLIKLHGARHIIFGTDWPWFTHESEIEHIERLLDSANFSETEKEHIFHANITALLGL
jgi:uncharacterized protein